MRSEASRHSLPDADCIEVKQMAAYTRALAAQRSCERLLPGHEPEAAASLPWLA